MSLMVSSCPASLQFARKRKQPTKPSEDFDYDPVADTKIDLERILNIRMPKGEVMRIPGTDVPPPEINRRRREDPVQIPLHIDDRKPPAGYGYDDTSKSPKPSGWYDPKRETKSWLA